MADDKKKTPETPAAEDDASTPEDGDANRDKAKAETPEPKPQGVTTTGEKTYTNAEMEKITQERLKAFQADEARKSEKVRKEAVAAALKEQGDWQKLADAREAEVRDAQARVAELEPIVVERDRYREALDAHLAAQRKGLPKHITQLLDLSDPVAQLKWLADNAEAVKAAVPPPTSNGSTPHRGAATTAIGQTVPQLPRPREPLARV